MQSVVSVELEPEVVVLVGFQADGWIDYGVASTRRKRHLVDLLFAGVEVGAGAVDVGAVGALDAKADVFPLTGQLGLVSDDDVVLHRLRNAVDFEFEGRVLDGANEAQTYSCNICNSC